MSEDRNLLGTLKKLISGRPQPNQKQVALDFVRHASAHLPPTEQSRIENLINLTNAFLKNGADIRDVKQQFDAFCHSHTSMIMNDQGFEVTSLSPVGDVLRQLLLACCQTELKSAKLVVLPTRYRPSAFEVGISAARVFAPSSQEAQRELVWQLSYLRSISADAVEGTRNKTVTGAAEDKGL